MWSLVRVDMGQYYFIYIGLILISSLVISNANGCFSFEVIFKIGKNLVRKIRGFFLEPRGFFLLTCDNKELLSEKKRTVKQI